MANKKFKDGNTLDSSQVYDITLSKNLYDYIQDKEQESFIVKDVTLSEDTNEWIIDGLDILADGGIYDVYIYGTASEKNDLHLQLNNIIDGYSTVGMAVNKSSITNTSGNLTFFSPYRYDKDAVYYCHTLSTTLSYIHDTISLLKENGNPIIEYVCAIADNTIALMGSLITVNKNNFSNITSIKLSLLSGNIKAGTRVLILRKISKRNLQD